MSIHYSDDAVTLHLGDSLDILPTLPDASVDAVVTDPPYGLEFMGKSWDAPWKTGNGFRRAANMSDAGRDNPFGRASRTSPEYIAGVGFQQWCEQWAHECLRVLKPGGHIAAFGGSRTYHRLACAIENAGFEIRDSLHWIYGSGFPKSLDVSKAIDKAREDRADTLRVTEFLAAARDAAGYRNGDLDEAFGFNGMAGHWTSQGAQPSVPTWEQWTRLRELLDLGPEMDAEVWRLNGRKGQPGNERPDRVVVSSPSTVLEQVRKVQNAGTPILEDAAHWSGWGTALKPAHEPIVLARKPLTGTVAGNVLQHGTGALNIDGCRTPTGREQVRGTGNGSAASLYSQVSTSKGNGGNVTPAAGRWPTNIVLTHQPILGEDGQPIGDACADGCVPGCPVAEMNQQSGVSRSPNKPFNYRRTTENTVYSGTVSKPDTRMGVGACVTGVNYGDEGGASRFFPVFRYEAKAPVSERPRGEDGTAHPTVKPLSLMRWLVRLVTPTGGLVLDPFAGSGTTLEAAAIEGFRAVGVEKHEPYAALCRARLSKPIAGVLFGDTA